MMASTLLGVPLLLMLALGLFACGATGTRTTDGAPGVQDGAVANTGGAAAATNLKGGRAASPFSGVTVDGKTISLDQYRGKPLLLVYMTHT